MQPLLGLRTFEPGSGGRGSWQCAGAGRLSKEGSLLQRIGQPRGALSLLLRRYALVVQQLVMDFALLSSAGAVALPVVILCQGIVSRRIAAIELDGFPKGRRRFVPSILGFEELVQLEVRRPESRGRLDCLAEQRLRLLGNDQPLVIFSESIESQAERSQNIHVCGKALGGVSQNDFGRLRRIAIEK